MLTRVIRWVEDTRMHRIRRGSSTSRSVPGTLVLLTHDGASGRRCGRDLQKRSHEIGLLGSGPF